MYLRLAISITTLFFWASVGQTQDWDPVIIADKNTNKKLSNYLKTHSSDRWVCPRRYKSGQIATKKLLSKVSHKDKKRGQYVLFLDPDNGKAGIHIYGPFGKPDLSKMENKNTLTPTEIKEAAQFIRHFCRNYTITLRSLSEVKSEINKSDIAKSYSIIEGYIEREDVPERFKYELIEHFKERLKNDAKWKSNTDKNTVNKIERSLDKHNKKSKIIEKMEIDEKFKIDVLQKINSTDDYELKAALEVYNSLNRVNPEKIDIEGQIRKSGSGGGMMIPGGPKTTELNLTIGAMCPECSKESHAIINPFEQPVTYTKVSIEKVDTFVEAAHKTYGSVMVAKKLLSIAEADNTIPGFNSAAEVKSLADGMMKAASKDIPSLISSGNKLVTNLPSESQNDPTKALVLDKALEGINTSIELLNEAKSQLAE